MATSYPIFYQTGGDPATHMAGLPLVAQSMFERLVEVKLDGKDFIPALAKKWKISPDWKFIDFFLRDDVKFHNGEIVTAEDVKYSLDTYLRKELRFLFRPLWIRTIKEIKVEGPGHVRVVMKAPDPGFLGRTWWAVGIFPKAYREKVGDKGFADHPIGAGPFKWNSYKQDIFWKIDAVKEHYRKTPEFKSFKLVYVPEASTRLAMLQAGEIDLARLSQADGSVIKKAKDLRIVYSKFPNLTNLTFADLIFPKENHPFHDKRVRLAASLAIDRKLITEKVLHGTAEPYGEALSPITAGHDPNIKPDPYDPERAKKLLAEAGYPKGFDTTISTTISSKFFAEALAANLTEVGIRTKVVIYESGAWRDAILGEKLRGLLIQGMWHHAELHAAADMSDLLSYMPWSYAHTPEIDKAIHSGAMAIEREDMEKAGRHISKTIREAQIKIFLWAQHTPYGVGSKIKYWQPIMGSQPASSFEYIKVN
ncbi:MAG: ABC transporter substrate-binding protein [Deltaproteobacteria bacterium]|nr:ABC transporter substrate-binding protein [Deltaproteobacteria bacterium]